ncbi:HAMP domain-containing sensor histidine kinase [Nocardioides sp. zg-1228]|uniref:sensor histidine kinase n=1 Tax=Nocardioides sp. zg-1228 TaxID=2763008 RepID=UPI001642CA29|nr:HAMP domain-containing sensor histidine kinase [Nocardioides sp. zg-1228]MBC2931693.1 HAMP domain-containing histidine kinase [Nocardioides sp. zg-1228]QSF57282.1 HAMP domain-containing histidine kinase [Nocardioides sp. zg-1228]
MPDRDLLPVEAGVDRDELARVEVRSLVASTFTSEGVMFGSMSLVGVEAGAWSPQVIQEFRLLNAALVARLNLEHARRSLAEAIEARAEAQAANQQFFGAVGHELRTPLATVLGYTEALLDDAEHGTADGVATGMKRDGPVIVRSCERLLTIVDSLLGAGRAMSTDDERQEVRLSDAVADVVHWHRTPARTAHVDMQAVIDPRLAAWGHPSAVRQILANLLGNAIAHHHPAGGTVHLSAEQLLGESGHPMVRVVVRDDGPGLTSEQLEHAFEPFVRFAAPATPGSGLGLSLSRTIAEREGGAVSGMSSPGAGSSFWLEVPAYVPQPSPE